MSGTLRIDWPWHVDRRGRTATVDAAGHVRDMVEQVLFTAPGERVNRPDFGSGALGLVFAPNSPELAAALQAGMRASLTRWLGDLIEVTDLEVTAEDATLRVVVAYVVRRSGEDGVATIVHGDAP